MSLFALLLLCAIRPDCDIVGAGTAPAVPRQAAVVAQPFDVATAISRSINQQKQKAAAANVTVKERVIDRRGRGLLRGRK